MDDKIKAALKTDGKLHSKLLDETKKLVELSRRYMYPLYSLWDANDRILRGDRVADQQDQKAVQRGEPPKMILPFSYAQSQTFIAFNSTLFTQRDKFFEILGADNEDDDSAEGSPELDAEDCLERELRKNQFNRILFQCFLDISRCGFCAVKSWWEEESTQQQQAQTEPAGESIFGGTLPEQTTTTTVTKFKRQGNKLMSVSPFRFFPDVRFPLSRLQDGEFCASEDEYSITRLKKMEADGLITNTDKIEKLEQVGIDRRRLLSLNADRGNILNVGAGTASDKGGGMGVLTEVQRWIVPNEFKGDDGGKPLGTDTAPILFLIWYVNDKTIVRAEPMNYEHNQFTFDVGEYSADQLRVVNESLAEIVDPLQTVATWFLNSRITSVRKNIDNKLIVDPTGVEVDDLVQRKPVIRLKPGVGRSGVDTWIKQLEVTDVTSGHVNDVKTLWEFMQIATGINDNALGQFSGASRPSAAQSRAVSAGAASRLKTCANVLWETLFVPMGQKLLSNLQANLSLEEFQRILGPKADQARLDAFKAERLEFEFFDGTAPSEKGYIAQQMQDLLLGLLANPQTAMMLGQEPFRSLVKEICDLRSIRSPERFLPPKQMQPSPTNILPYGQPGPTAAGTQPTTTGQPPATGTGATGQPAVASGLPS